MTMIGKVQAAKSADKLHCRQTPVTLGAEGRNLDIPPANMPQDLSRFVTRVAERWYIVTSEEETSSNCNHDTDQ